MHSARNSSFSHARRLLRASLLIGFFTYGGILAQASELLLWSRPGGPMQYNGHGGVWTDDGYITLVSVTFDLPEAVRIESVRAWINGPAGGEAFVSIKSVSLGLDTDLSHSIPIEQVHAPADWQGVSGLDWRLAAGSYTIFIQAPSIPYAFGFQGTELAPLYDLYDYRDYSGPDEPKGFGLEVYGTQLSAIPEPSTYGLMGSVALLGIAAHRKFRRSRLNCAQ